MLVALIAEGALDEEVALSNLELGRACFAHEEEKLGEQAMRKRISKLVRELEEVRILQVTAVKVGKGHGRNKYRVTLDPETHTERQQVQELPKTPPKGQEPNRGPQAGMMTLKPRKKPLLPPHLRHLGRRED